MLSYPIDEAETLLDSKLSAAKLSLSNCEEDLDFLREQITVRRLPLTFSQRSLANHVAALTDHGGGGCPSVQLGCRAKAQRKGGRGEGGGEGS